MPEQSAAPSNPGELRQYLLGLAEGLTAAGESVDRVRAIMHRIAAAYGVPDTGFVVLPTVILVQTGGASTGHVAVSSRVAASLRFDQIAALYGVVHEAEDGTLDPADGIRRLNAVGSMRPRFGWIVRTLGHGVLTLGLSLLLLPSGAGAAIAFGLGLVIGLMKLVRSPTLDLVFPVVAAFVSALTVFLLADWLGLGDPLTVLVAPLVTFLPGGVLTTATVELAAGQMIAGASRLVTGLVQLALLSFGIIAAGTLAGVSNLDYVAAGGSSLAFWWIPLLGLLLFSIGNYLHFSAPAKAYGWVLVVLLIAYVGQFIGARLFGPEISGFVGALAMTPAVLWIDGLRRGVPSQITFLPAFWLLVPGATGVIGVTEAVGANLGSSDFVDALVGVMAIALGVLIGTALYRTVRSGATQLEHFHIEIPAPEPDEAHPVPFWRRLLRRER